MMRFLYVALLLVAHANGMAISSSGKSSKKGRAASTQRKGGGGGFGVKKRSVPITHTRDDSDSTQKLVAFLQAQKATGVGDTTEVGYCMETGRRGVYANKPFNKKEIICAIPSDMALALSDPALKGEDAPTIAHAGRNFLQMYVDEPKVKAMWSPYLDTLPTKESQFAPTPDYYDDEEIDLLEFPRIVNRAKERKQQIQQVAQEAGMDYDTLQFATWLVSSRTFSISVTDDSAETTDADGNIVQKAGLKSIRVLCPYLDMINHSSDQPNAELHLIDPEKDEAYIAIRATRPISSGKEICISYGSSIESSVELLLNYGFIPETNPIDNLMLKKGGDDTFPSVDKWSTTLQEDGLMLGEVGNDDGNLRNILEFRVRLKRAYQEGKQE